MIRGGIFAIAWIAIGCGHSSASTSGDDASSLDAPLGPPTASSWLGVNVAGDLPWTDITHQLAPFDTAAAQRDANGYPIAGASGTSNTDIGFVLASGTYKIS
jgi:hypothetical protein